MNSIYRYHFIILSLFGFFIQNTTAQKIAFSENSPLQIPLELQPEDLRQGAKIVVSAPLSVACSGQVIEGFMQCADENDATLNISRNDWWNGGSPPANALPSESYIYNFPSIETDYPCVAGIAVEELILTITINSVTFDLSSPYACCEEYLQGIYADIYDNCPINSFCDVVGDGLNNFTPGAGDCSPTGDHLIYDAGTNSFPLGIPYTSETTCLNSIIGTGEELGIDIVPLFLYENALANGCNCTQDLISQGLISVDYDLQVEYKFCESNLPNGCYPASFTPIGPLCENDAPVVLPTVSNNGITGSWDPTTIDPNGLGGTTVTATFTPTAGQCVVGEAVMEVEIEELIVPSFTPVGPLCESDPPVNLPTISNNGVTGSWDVGPTFDPNGLGGTTVTIVFAPDAGQCAAHLAMNVQVIEDVSPTFTPIGPLCESDPPVTLPAISNNGVTGIWDVGPTFDPNGLGGYTVSVTFIPTAGQCANFFTMYIVVETCLPACTMLTSPLNNSVNVDVEADLFWTVPSGKPTINYKLTVGTSPGLGDILNDFDVGNVTTYDPGTLPAKSPIYVKITPYNTYGEAAGCTEEVFSTGNCISYANATWVGSFHVWDLPQNWDPASVPTLCTDVLIPSGFVLVPINSPALGRSLEVQLGAILEVPLGAILNIEP